MDTRYRGLWTHALDQLEARLDDVPDKKRGGRHGR